MRLAYVSNSTIPSKTANSVHVMKMSSAFSARVENYTLIVPDIYSGESIDVFGYYGVLNKFVISRLAYPTFIPGKAKLHLYSLFAVARCFIRSVDFVYGRNVLACSLYSILGGSSAVELHSPLESLGRLEQWAIFRALKRNPEFFILVISSALKEILINEGVPPERVFVAHDGADLPTAADDEGSLSITDSSYAMHVGYVGHLYAGRGIDIILRVAERLPAFQFHIVGGNDQEIEKLKVGGVSANVKFHGFVSPANAFRYRNKFDVLLAPYQQVVSIKGKGDTSKYMSPLKIFEYMSSQKAIVSSDLPVLREVLDERNSMLVKSDDISAWVAALNILNADLKMRGCLAKNAYADFCEKYTWSARAELLANIFAGILERKK